MYCRWPVPQTFRFQVLCGFTCRQSASLFEAKECCDLLSNIMFVSTHFPHDDTLATAIFSKLTPLLATWYWPDAVTGWVFGELDGAPVLIVVVVCLVAVSFVELVSLHILIWCLRWCLWQWCLDVQALTLCLPKKFKHTLCSYHIGIIKVWGFLPKIPPINPPNIYFVTAWQH